MITSTGVGSGLDINSIIPSLMAVEQRPLTLLQQREATMQTRISAFGALKSQLSSLGDVAAKLAKTSAWNPLKAESTDSAAVGVSATASAVAGKHSLQVQQLAQGQVLASSAFASSASVVGTGTLRLELGTTEAGVFTPKDGSSAVEITIGSEQQTLAGIRDAINAAGAGVTASIVTGSGGAQLVLRSADGAENSIRLSAVDDDGNDLDGSGLSALAYDPAAAVGAGRNMLQTQAAQDAKFTLDGIEVTSATNAPSTVLEGVTLNLRKVTSEPVTLTISTDSSALRKTVEEFVTAFNNLTKLLKQQTQSDPGGSNNGPLQADATAIGLLNGMREMLRGTVSGLGGINSLNAAGIELTRDGTLQIDDKRFATLLEDPNQLARLFTQPQSGSDAGSRGFALRFEAWAKALAGEEGVLASRVEGLKDSVKSNQKQQDTLAERLARTEARLRAQYQRLDTQMSDLNARMAQLRSSLGLG